MTWTWTWTWSSSSIRQTDRQAGRQTDRQTGKHIGRQTGNHTKRQERLKQMTVQTVPYNSEVCNWPSTDLICSNIVAAAVVKQMYSVQLQVPIATPVWAGYLAQQRNSAICSATTVDPSTYELFNPARPISSSRFGHLKSGCAWHFMVVEALPKAPW